MNIVSSTSNPRIVLYSHDTMGLGHLRRNLLIATALAGSSFKPNVLLISGSKELKNFSFPQGVDSLTLPSIYKSSDGQYSASQFDLSLETVISLRANLILSAIKSFKPDVFIADNVPRGVAGELDPLLDYLSTKPKVYSVLGLRDILDDPTTIRKEWLIKRNQKIIEEYYDEVWVYGDRSVYDQAQEYRFLKGLTDKLHYLGYLDPRTQSRLEKNDNQLPSVKTKKPYSLCMAGGGQDSIKLVEMFAKSIACSDHRGVILTGPFLPSEIRANLNEIARYNARLKVVRFHDNPITLIREADKIVSMGGYNSVCEIIAMAKKPLIVPRVIPRQEQWIRACKFEQLGLIDVLHPDHISVDVLVNWLAKPISSKTIPYHLNFKGLESLLARTAEILDDKDRVFKVRYHNAEVVNINSPKLFSDEFFSCC